MKSRAITVLLVLFCALVNLGAEPKSKFKYDFETPQGAILCLEAAYRSGNMERILECKDFRLEAVYLLKHGLKKEEYIQDEEIMNELEETLKLAFMAEIKDNGIPDFTGISENNFGEIKIIDETYVVVEEEFTYSDGDKSKQLLVVGKSAKGWRMVSPKE